MVSALGVFFEKRLASIGGGFNVDGYRLLFGSILVIPEAEMGLSMLRSLTLSGVAVLRDHDLFMTPFDDESAKVLGIRTRWIHTVLVVCTALTVVLGIRVVGILLVSSLMIFPAVTALQLASGFKPVLWGAALIAALSVWIGIGGSYIADFPKGATLVVANFVLFLSLAFFAFLQERWKRCSA